MQLFECFFFRQSVKNILVSVAADAVSIPTTLSYTLVYRQHMRGIEFSPVTKEEIESLFLVNAPSIRKNVEASELHVIMECKTKRAVYLIDHVANTISEFGNLDVQ
jgi:hypothetical protein